MPHLPVQLPVFGIQARGLQNPAEVPDTVEQMAAEYLQLMRKIQPVGPYNLLGWSFGGLVAHAIATQLQEVGESVSLLSILDAYPNEHGPELDIEDEQSGGYSLTDPAAQLGLNPDYSLPGQNHALSEIFDEQRTNAIVQVFHSSGRLARNYAPTAFTGNMLLFAAAKRMAPAPVDSWKPYVSGSLNVYRIECDHMEMMQTQALSQIGNILASNLHCQEARDQEFNFKREEATI